MAALVAVEPALAGWLRPTPGGEPSISFADPAAVQCLNRALLRLHYGIADWSIPEGYLCPPIPGRADYLHYLADLLAADAGPASAEAARLPTGARLRVLDIGTGANLIYPLIGQHEYGWQFVGADIDPAALANGERILRANPLARAAITLRRQPDPHHHFTGIIRADEYFALTLCNPPFHRSQAEADAGAARKWRGLATSRAERAGRRTMPSPQPASTVRNFGGQGAELACPRGEAAFIAAMIADSRAFAGQVLWFSTLVSQAANLPRVYRALANAGVAAQQTVAMAQGQKQSRFVAWTFLSAAQRRHWWRRLAGFGS